MDASCNLPSIMGHVCASRPRPVSSQQGGLAQATRALAQELAGEEVTVK
jgi:hypothetical protein